MTDEGFSVLLGLVAGMLNGLTEISSGIIMSSLQFLFGFS